MSVIEHARKSGAEQLLLNTLPTMTHAIALYRSLGFIPTESYVNEPTVGVLYFSLDLRV